MQSNYNKELKPFARKLRNDSTSGEIKLWSEVLQNKKMKGYQFNRQFPINNYIADFICRKLKLIIEIDGYSHEFKFDKDTERDKELYNLGYTTLRVTEKDVLSDLSNVILEIEGTITELEKKV